MDLRIKKGRLCYNKNICPLALTGIRFFDMTIWSVRKPPSCRLEPVRNTNREISLNSIAKSQRDIWTLFKWRARNGKTHPLQDTDDLSHVEYSCGTPFSTERLYCLPNNDCCSFSSLWCKEICFSYSKTMTYAHTGCSTKGNSGENWPFHNTYHSITE